MPRFSFHFISYFIYIDISFTFSADEPPTPMITLPDASSRLTFSRVSLRAAEEFLAFELIAALIERLRGLLYRGHFHFLPFLH